MERKAAASWFIAAAIKAARQLFGLRHFDYEIHFGTACPDGDVLDDASVGGPVRLTMERFDFVTARRDVFDRKGAVLGGDSVERMIHQSGVGEHPRMHFAFKLQKNFGM